MGAGSIRVGSIAGITVNAHWSVLVIAAVLCANLAPSIGWTASSIAVVGFLGSIVVHELSHALTARRFGVDTEAIQLWALGGVARLSREAPTPKAEAWIAAAGPLASLALGVGALGGWLAVDDRAGWLGPLLGWFGLVNAMLAVFNLLPGAPLDGGRILRALRWQMHGNRYRAMREAGNAGGVLGWALAGIGIVLILREQSGVWLVLTGVFVALNAQAEIAVAAIGERLTGVRVRDLTWFGVAEVSSDMDTDSMLWQRSRLGAAGGVAVTDAEGRMQGFVLEDEMWAIPAEQRPWVMLTQLMVPLERATRAAPDDDLASVLPVLDPRHPLVTVWEDGVLVGLIPPKRLREQIAARG